MGFGGAGRRVLQLGCGLLARKSRGKRAGAILIWIAACSPASAQLPQQPPANPPLITLEQAASRTGNDYSPVYEGRSVHVRGQVATAPIWAVGSYFLSLADASQHALIVRGRQQDFDGLIPGDWIEITGTIHRRAGLPMLTPDSLERVDHTAPPAPKKLTFTELSGFRYLGLPVEAAGTITGMGANTGGKLLALSDRGRSIGVFLPNPNNSASFDLSHVHSGDRVRIRGLATQYDLEPPYDGDFQIMVGSPSGIDVLDSGAAAPPPRMVAAIVLMVALALAAWWLKERRVIRQRRTARIFHTLIEEIISAASPAEIAEKLSRAVPEVIAATSTQLYIFQRAAKSLERVPTAADPEPMAAPVDSPPEGMGTPAVVCFRNRTVLSVPDVRRNPLVKSETRTGLPRSAIFLPLLAGQPASGAPEPPSDSALGGSEPLGVLELDNSRRVGYYSPEDQAAAQHLANQVAASLRLQAQQAMREQLFRSEKLAATGQLISGVAGELKAPLERVVQLAGSLAARGAAEPAVRELCAESQRAVEIVSRLVSFSQNQAAPEGGAEGAADVHAVLSGLIQFREPEWRSLGIRAHTRLSAEPAVVASSRGHIEQVFLNLLVHAQQRAIETAAKNIGVQTHILAGKLVVEITFAAPADASSASDGPLQPSRAAALGLGVCHAIVSGLGGEIRFRVSAGSERFDVELPLLRPREPRRNAAPRPSREGAAPYRPLTLMLVDGDAAAQRQLVAFLASRGHRVVPVLAAEAPELAQRLRFDAIFWAVRTGGGRWSEYHERLRNAVGAFVLLSDGYDHNLARSLEANGGFLLATPVTEVEADRVLAEIALRAEASPAR